MNLNDRLRLIVRKIRRRRAIDSTLPVDYRGQAAGDLIRRRLDADSPCAIGRLGRIELETLLRCQDDRPWGSVSGDTALQRGLHWNAGFFPTEEGHIRRFARRYLEELGLLDVLGSWLPGERRLRNAFPDAQIIPLADLEPYLHPNPWSQALAGRKVLVVHPFAGSILSQYARRQKLFDDPRVLPPFELMTIRAVQTIAGNLDERPGAGGVVQPFADWFAALEWMCAEIAATDFDVAIIGAGAYGLPLAAQVKRLGRKAIHLGGATQILFGIKGRRWDRHPQIGKLYNAAWVRPSAEETPADHTRVEAGCYW